jgi:hypothetical protein
VAEILPEPNVFSFTLLAAASVAEQKNL